VIIARPHAQPIPQRNLLKRHFRLAAIRRDPPRRLGREAKQRLDRAGGPFACPQFQHLPEQNQHDDHRRRFEIDRD